MLPRIVQTLVVALVLVLSTLPANAANRVALVVGNGVYQYAPTLANPKNDAADLAAALRDIGFEVIERQDADERGMADAVREFSRKLPGSELALFYYAGHGLQVAGNSYLLPVNIKVESPADLRFGAVDLATIQEVMDADKKRANLIILDACRDNPFVKSLTSGGRSIASRGLARPDYGGIGTLIAFATQPGNIADDGSGRNSPFTAALLKHIKTPGLEVRQMLSRVRADVIDATGEKQVPWDNSSLRGEVYLVPPAAVPMSSEASVALLHTPDRTAEVVFWQSVERENTRELYEAYLAKYGTDGHFAPIARARIAALSSKVEQASAPGTSAAPPQVAVLVPGPATSPSASQAVAECDRLAADPYDRTRPAGVNGVDHRNLDLSKAVPACETAVAQSPLPRLFHQLGRVYLAKQERKQALRSFERAAEAGHPAALAFMGSFHVLWDPHVLGLSPDKRRGISYLEQAAQLGYAPAFARLGDAYLRGEGVDKDIARGISYFEQAARAGYPTAYAELGSAYLSGRGVDKDDAAGVRYFEQAAALGDIWALSQLGWMHRYGKHGLPQDNKKALGYYEQAASQGDTTALVYAGQLHLEGAGAGTDVERAMTYFARAESSGHARALVALGHMYEAGRLVPKDERRAIDYFERAGSQGNKDGYFYIGMLHEYSDTSRDLAKARSYYERGGDYSIFLAAKMYADGQGGPQDLGRARQLFERAAEAGVEGAMKALLDYYEKGIGGPKDPARAVNLRRRLEAKKN